MGTIAAITAAQCLFWEMSASAEFYYGAGISINRTSYTKESLPTQEAPPLAFFLNSATQSGSSFSYLTTVTGPGSKPTSVFSANQNLAQNIFSYAATEPAPDLLLNNDDVDIFRRFWAAGFLGISEKEYFAADATSSLSEAVIKNGKIVQIGDVYYLNFGKNGFSKKDFENALQSGTDYLEENPGVCNKCQGNWLSQASLSDLQQSFDRTEKAMLKSNAAGIEYSLSALIGYRAFEGNFAYGFEASLEASRSKIGDNKKYELELKHNFGLNLVGRLGYSFIKGTSLYGHAGVGIRNQNVKFVGLGVNDINESKIMPTIVFGAGFEVDAWKGGRLFYEINHIASLAKIKTIAGKVITSTTGMKFGFRQAF